MTTQRLVRVHCNECGVGIEYDSWAGVGSGLDGTAAEARAEAKSQGWAVGLPGGRDLCPEHKPTP